MKLAINLNAVSNFNFEQLAAICNGKASEPFIPNERKYIKGEKERIILVAYMDGYGSFKEVMDIFGAESFSLAINEKNCLKFMVYVHHGDNERLPVYSLDIECLPLGTFETLWAVIQEVGKMHFHEYCLNCLSSVLLFRLLSDRVELSELNQLRLKSQAKVNDKIKHLLQTEVKTEHFKKTLEFAKNNQK